MGFYGNISNDGKTNLTFDKIYPNRMTMDQNVEKDGVFIGRFVLVEYDDNTHTRRQGYKNPNEPYNKLYHDSEYKIPYYLSADTKEGYGLQAGDLVYIIKNGHLFFYRATGEKHEFDSSAVFVPIAESNGDPGDYVLNYNIDKGHYNNFTNGWDSTVWQKAVIEGKETYRMIATLNSLIPRFGVVAEAPSEEPIAPHFGYENTNIDYILHMPTNWGFRIKEAENKELSDEFEVINTTNTNGEKVEITKHHDIFYNKSGFEKEERNYKEKQENYISLTPTGISGENYTIHNEDGTISIDSAPDIQEFSLHLPIIGNMASDFWDLMYSQERNTKIGWNNSDGIKFIKRDEETGNYIFDETQVESVAGVINSTQDLMGKIIRLGKNLEDADTNHIYFRTFPKEDGSGSYSGFYIKELSNELISFNELNEKYNLAFADYKDYIAGKNPQYLQQYNKGEYYIAVESGVEDLYNYYLEIGESPTTDTKYYSIMEEDVEAIKLIQWEPTSNEDWNEITEEDRVAYYYKTEEVIGNKTYYNYVKDINKNPDLEKDYYDVNATRIYNLNFYNPEDYSEYNVETGEYSHKKTGLEEGGYPVYRGYFYYNDEKKELVPVYTQSNPTVFDPEEEYYIFSYTMVPATEETGKTTIVYKLNGLTDLNPEEDLVGNQLFVQSFIDFNTQELYTSDDIRSEYKRVKYLSEIKEGTTYYTLSPTLLNGYLAPEAEEEEEKVDKIDTQFYSPDVYYYKTASGDYLIDRSAKMSKNRQYYKFIKYPSGNIYTFYEPNKYYYYSVSLDGDKLDDSSIMRTAEDSDVVVQQLEGREDFIYYLKRQAYVVADTSNHLNIGQVWNVNTNTIPEGVVLGVLFNDVVDELIAKGHDVEKKYVWRELKGFSKDLNTINGLILQLNKTYRFDDELTRDLTTIKGTINTLKDYFTKFDILTPGYLLAVNEYGQLDSQNPGELTLKEYKIGKKSESIRSNDTINEAFGKLEYKVDILNADAFTEGSVAHAIAEIVEVDGGAIDKLKEVSAWIIDDKAGAAKIIADVENNTKAISANKTAIETNLANYEKDKNLLNYNLELIQTTIKANQVNHEADILALQNLVGEKSVETQISEAITAENLAQYALATELDTAKGRITAIEENIENWNKAEENVQSNWLEEDETSDAYIQNKPDLSDVVRTTDLDDVVKLDTTFDYIYSETTTAMTISALMGKIAELETRIAILENPVSPEPEPEEPTE